MINESKENYYFMRSDAAFFTSFFTECIFFKHKAYNDKHTHTKVKKFNIVIEMQILEVNI